MQRFPSVNKSFGRLSRLERLRDHTVKAIAAALLAAGVVAAANGQASARTPAETIRTTPVAGVIVLTPSPAISISDGRVQVAGHVSHSSHASHASHGSHCSGYSYCG